MPYAMIHIEIALNILSKTNMIKSPEDFILGTLAPDAVHFRQDYHSDMKLKSHLCVGEEKWGFVTNNDEWLESIMGFYHNNKNLGYDDYLLGYCCHLISDIENNKTFWTPFRLKVAKDTRPNIGKKYVDESLALDYKFYQDCQWESLCGKLGVAVAQDFEGILCKEEVKRLRDDFIKSRFQKDRASNDLDHEFVKYDEVIKYIHKTSDYILSQLFQK